MDTIKKRHFIKRIAAWILSEQIDTFNQHIAMQAHIARYWHREAEKAWKREAEVVSTLRSCANIKTKRATHSGNML